MTAKQLKNKLSKKTPLLMSPFGFALAACGGGGGSDGDGQVLEENNPIYSATAKSISIRFIKDTVSNTTRIDTVTRTDINDQQLVFDNEDSVKIDLSNDVNVTLNYNSRDLNENSAGSVPRVEGGDLVYYVKADESGFNWDERVELLRLENAFDETNAISAYNWMADGYDKDYSLLVRSSDQPVSNESVIIFGTDQDDIINVGDGTTGGWNDNGKRDEMGSEAYGADGDDIVFGGKGANFLSMGPGDDIIYGGAGDDFLFGGMGNDKFYGQEGDDILGGANNFGDDYLNGGLGRDHLTGGYGNDTFDLSGISNTADRDIITDFGLDYGDKIMLSSSTHGLSQAGLTIVSAANYTGDNQIIADLADVIETQNYTFLNGKPVIAYSTDEHFLLYDQDGDMSSNLQIIAEFRYAAFTLDADDFIIA